MDVFFFGMGYSSTATARALRTRADADIPVVGTTRGEAAALPKAPRLHHFAGDAPSPALRPDLAAATHVIASIPPDAQGDPALRHHAADIAAATQLKWLGYFSTVGVYGDFDGAWIDETALTAPSSTRGRQRLIAEQQWRDFAAQRGVPLFVLRLAGIYGPGRSPFDKLRDGTAHRIVKPNQVFNRIHVEDIGRITALAATQELVGTFNLADDLPAPPQDVIAHAAALLHMEPPPAVDFATAALSPMARSFYADNKRVANGAIKRALGIDLLYPTYREGLAQVLASESIPA